MSCLRKENQFFASTSRSHLEIHLTHTVSYDAPALWSREHVRHDLLDETTLIVCRYTMAPARGYYVGQRMWRAAMNRSQVDQDVVASVLGPILRADYSVMVYGARDRVPLDTLGIVHLSLLRRSEMHGLARRGGICIKEALHDLPPFFTPINPKFDLHGAVWIRRFPQQSAPNHSWVEVTHCGGGCQQCEAKAAAWF